MSEGTEKFRVSCGQEIKDIRLTVYGDPGTSSITLTGFEARYLGRVLLQMGWGDLRHE